MDNLTGGQIQEVLDALIYSAVGAVVKAAPNSFDAQLAHLTVMTTRNRKRKISALERDDFISAACNALLERDVDKKIEVIADSKIERSFVYGFLNATLERCEPYHRVYEEWLTAKGARAKSVALVRLQVCERDMGAVPGELFCSLNVARDYLEQAYAFRNSIVQNYIKLAYKQARSFMKSRAGTFDFDDVHHNILAAVTLAMDKFDASKGALTSYIGYWVLNTLTTGNSRHGHEYGIAYTIPQVQRKSLAMGEQGEANFSYSLNHKSSIDGEDGAELADTLADSTDILGELIQSEESRNLRRICKRADVSGLGRLYLEIDEVHSPKERRKMRQIMKQQGLA